MASWTRRSWLLPSIGWLLAQGAVAGPIADAFGRYEAAGAVIGEVRIQAGEIFDLTDARENLALFRLANRLHIQTQPNVIRRALLFRSGEPVSVRRIEETERLLRSERYLYDACLLYTSPSPRD